MLPTRFDLEIHASRMRATGFWRDELIDTYLQQATAQTPEKVALVGYRTDRDVAVRLTYAELSSQVARAAGGLQALGVGPGDVVAIQLPNWPEFVVATLACWRLGAVANPLMPIFRDNELTYMLGFSEAKVLICPMEFRGHDHCRMGERLKQGISTLQHVICVDDDGPGGYDAVLLNSASAVPPPPAPALAPLRPDALAVLMFTSGTTGFPKGVMHTNNTLIANTFAVAGRFGLTEDDVLFACSPFGHMTAFVAVLMLSLRLGATVVLQDIWDGKRGVRIINCERASYIAAATPFLNDICEAAQNGEQPPTTLRSFLCGGAQIPPVLIERADRELGIKVCSLWGMTEALSGTLTEPARAAEKSSRTDGRAMEGMEVKILDMDGSDVPAGTTGRLMVRGAQMFIGYYKRPDLETRDADGWFDTGDLAYMDDEGYIRINGRLKDVLIRGGENVPVFEIENLLCKHPSVASVAIVGYPDTRLGERACAFIVLRADQQLTLPEMQAYLESCHVAKQYWPERVEILPSMPSTPTGKITKHVLRERLKTVVAAG